MEAARPYVNGTAGPLMAKDDILKIRIRPGGDLINSYDPTLATNQRCGGMPATPPARQAGGRSGPR